jgi:hypothetical protein
LKEAILVEEGFLKPYCSLTKILLWQTCEYSPLKITLSKILEIDVSTEISQ